MAYTPEEMQKMLRQIADGVPISAASRTIVIFARIAEAASRMRVAQNEPEVTMETVIARLQATADLDSALMALAKIAQ